MSKNRLGKGLNALIGENSKLDRTDSGDNKTWEVFVHEIEPNPFQPRQEFDEDSLRELAQSIKEKGVIQPIILRQVKPNNYQLVAGERRWRASQMAGLKKIPSLIREYNDLQMMEIALIENLQREDLNPIEEAQAYQKMMEEFNMTQETLAKKIGKGRSSVANIVRLLNLPPKVQIYVSRETLSMGHARAILAIKDAELQIEVADYVIENNLSVRETEKHIQCLNYNKKKTKVIKNDLEPEWIEARQLLTNYFGTNVKIQQKKDKKYITIECKDYQDIKKLLKRIDLC